MWEDDGAERGMIPSARKAHTLTNQTKLSRVDPLIWTRISSAINEATWDGKYQAEVEVEGSADVIVGYLEDVCGYDVCLVAPEHGEKWKISIDWTEVGREATAVIEFEEDEDYE